jgi:hypothetical protein
LAGEEELGKMVRIRGAEAVSGRGFAAGAELVVIGSREG